MTVEENPIQALVVNRRHACILQPLDPWPGLISRRLHAAPESWLETDPQTGRTYLKLPAPAPAPETLQCLASALGDPLAGLRQR